MSLSGPKSSRKTDPKSAIYSDLKDSKAAAPYINVWVVPAKDKDNPVYAQLVKIYHQSAVIDGLLAESKGTAVAQNQTPAQLQKILTGLEKDVKAAKH